MQIEQPKKCGHLPCVCEIPPDQEFCGESCREKSAASSDTCMCGHGDCAVAPADADLVMA